MNQQDGYSTPLPKECQRRSSRGNFDGGPLSPPPAPRVKNQRLCQLSSSTSLWSIHDELMLPDFDLSNQEEHHSSKSTCDGFRLKPRPITPTPSMPMSWMNGSHRLEEGHLLLRPVPHVQQQQPQQPPTMVVLVADDEVEEQPEQPTNKKESVSRYNKRPRRESMCSSPRMMIGRSSSRAHQGAMKAAGKRVTTAARTFGNAGSRATNTKSNTHINATSAVRPFVFLKPSRSDSGAW